jgi:hypothetical protein
MRQPGNDVGEEGISNGERIEKVVVENVGITEWISNARKLGV